jgi:hypothetical protein
MERWARPVILLLVVALLTASVAEAGDVGPVEPPPRDVDAWVLVLEPTEAYWNLQDGLWSMTDEVFWTAHAGEWYVLLIALFDPVDGDRVLVFRDDDEDETPVWLLLDDRVEVFVEQDIPPLCGGAIVLERCVGTPLP